MDIGVFIPIGNNGWLISTTAPQYKPTFDLNRQIVQKAEQYGLEFALSMIKLRGFGGKTEFWDHNLESFTLMAGLAAVTQRIQLYASVAVLTIPPLRERHVRILWASWHLVSILGGALAAILIAIAQAPATPLPNAWLLKVAIAASLAGSALVLFATRGRHPGWLSLLVAAILAWLGASSL